MELSDIVEKFRIGSALDQEAAFADQVTQKDLEKTICISLLMYEASSLESLSTSFPAIPTSTRDRFNET
jgi:hypothetical protein